MPKQLPKEQGLTPVVILILVVFIALGVALFLGFQSKGFSSLPKACTEEALICPDGSSVGRSGPNCEFAPCPTTTNANKEWKTYSNDEYQFTIKYPPNWKYEDVILSPYTNEQDEVWFSNGEFPAADTDARSEITIRMTDTKIMTDYNPMVWWDPQYFNDYANEKYNLGNVPAQKISGVNKEGLNQEMVVVAKVGTVYFEVQTNQSPEALQYFDQILKTFVANP